MVISTHLPCLTDANVVLSTPKNGLVETEIQDIDCIASVQLIALETQLPESVKAYVSAALADNTRRAYQGDLKDFLRWGGTVPCQPELLAEYIAERAEVLSPYTITRRVIGISRAHVSQGLTDPSKSDLVRTVLRGMRRKHGAPQRQVAPLIKEDLQIILPLMRGSKGIRDRALLLLGFAAALRRSELVALDITHLSFVKEGLIIQLQQCKTDQESIGRNIAIPFGRTHLCPVKAVEAWMAHAQIASGALFRSVGKGSRILATRLTAPSVAFIVKGYAKRAGLNAADMSGHSLRSGFVTSAAQVGVPINKIQQQTGHRSFAMLARYMRDKTLFENNASGFLF